MTEPLHLPDVKSSQRTEKAFEVPTAVIEVNRSPEVAGQLLVLLAEYMVAGGERDWARRELEASAARVVVVPELLEALLGVSRVAQTLDYISEAEAAEVVAWAEALTAENDRPMPGLAVSPESAEWDAARDALQAWIDRIPTASRTSFVRQKSSVRVSCADCKVMLAWLVEWSGVDLIVLRRGDDQEFEVGHAVGERGGYTRTRCGKRGGRHWVLHADHLASWRHAGHAKVALRHSDKDFVGH